MSGLAGQLGRLRRSIPQLKIEIANKVIAREAANFHNANFRKQQWTEKKQKWKKRKNNKDKGRAILVKTGALRRAATSPEVRGNVVDFVMPLYGKIHNEGVGKMPRRQFAGQSTILKARFKAKAKKIIKQHLNSL